MMLGRMELTVQQQSALALASMGFWVFPIVPGRKSPPLEFGWQGSAARDSTEILRAWREHPAANIGISTSKFGASEALIVIDVDCKEGRVGNEELLRLEFEGCEFPDTYVQTTPTGGRHLVFRADQAVRQGVSVLGRNLDIRSAGGYIVGAGSTIEGRYYQGAGRVCRAPDWLIARLNPVPQVRQTHAVVVPVDIQAAAEQVKAYLAGAPVATEGQGGDETTYKVAAGCKDFGVSESLTLELMAAHWNERCLPPWGIDALKEKVAHAYRYGKHPVGSRSPEAAFAGVVPSVVQPGVGPIDQLNREYAFVTIGGGHSILFETTDEFGRAKLDWLSPESFHLKLASKTMTDVNGTTTPLTKTWMKSPRRRSFDGVVFCPGREVDPRFYNLWKGFQCEGAATGQHPGVQRFLEHAFENVCNKDAKLYTWLIDYFAHLVQKPWEKPLVALVFRGGKGVGKTTLIDRVGALLGSHYLLASNRRFLVGNFNSHLERVLLLALDEAFWSGDHAAEGVLKDMITGNRLLIERKGFEPYQANNYIRVVVIGNEKWLVPASADERRFAVFDVGDGRKQDTKYFAAMREQLERDGYPYLLTYLQTHTITSDQNIAPHTAAMQDQKLHSLDIVHQWWYDCLTSGSIPGYPFDTWPEWIGAEELRTAFRYYVRQRNVNSRIPGDSLFTRMIVEVSPSVTPARRSVDGKQVRVLTLKPLATHRKEWDKFIGQPTAWGNDDSAGALLASDAQVF